MNVADPGSNSVSWSSAERAEQCVESDQAKWKVWTSDRVWTPGRAEFRLWAELSVDCGQS